MLRVGLTGGLGSGKSTVAAALRQLGAHVIEADELGRQMMEPGQRVYAEIVRVFGPEVVGADGRLIRPRLAELAFKEGRLAELNAIVHPAVIHAQMTWMDGIFANDPGAVAVVESALIFEVERDARKQDEQRANQGVRGVLSDWRRRFDRVIIVTAPDELKIARYVARIGGSDKAVKERAATDARARLALQMPDEEKARRADFVLENTGDLAGLQAQVRLLWDRLKAEGNNSPSRGSLE